MLPRCGAPDGFAICHVGRAPGNSLVYPTSRSSRSADAVRDLELRQVVYGCRSRVLQVQVLEFYESKWRTFYESPVVELGGIRLRAGLAHKPPARW